MMAAFQNSVVFTCKPFPAFDQHCGGYAGTLGPSKSTIRYYYLALTSATQHFAKQSMRSLDAVSAACDHTYRVTHNIKSKHGDAPVESLFGVVNEQNMFIAAVLTCSASIDERVGLASELYDRRQRWGRKGLILSRSSVTAAASSFSSSSSQL